MSLSLQRIEHELKAHQPRRNALRRILRRAAVAMILRERRGEVEVLMIRRAEVDGDPWSGHMAFPGGGMEKSDRHGFDIAVRETLEEIGADISGLPCLGRLSEIQTHFRWRKTMVISPYIFRLDHELAFSPNYEVDEVLWVPLGFLASGDNREHMVFERGRLRIPLHCYMYKGRRIWGLSLRMLDELMELLGQRP